MLNIKGAEETRRVQALALQSRLHIPLLFGLDVIHGYRTVFPVPLGEAASWDIDAIEQSARIAAREASASGIHWTFAPMVDIGRDPRWGRVMEGAGEDSYLGARIAAARVRGFQGEKLGGVESVMATAKHFATYGAATAGRDYNAVDMSDRMLRETYLPPFKAAADAGVATFMNAFNTLNGVPGTGNRMLQRDIFKGEWKFKGFVVSDWGSVGEMVAHGYAAGKQCVFELAGRAGEEWPRAGSAGRRRGAAHPRQEIRAGAVRRSLSLFRCEARAGRAVRPAPSPGRARDRGGIDRPAEERERRLAPGARGAFDRRDRAAGGRQARPRGRLDRRVGCGPRQEPGGRGARARRTRRPRHLRRRLRRRLPRQGWLRCGLAGGAGRRPGGAGHRRKLGHDGRGEIARRHRPAPTVYLCACHRLLEAYLREERWALLLAHW